MEQLRGAWPGRLRADAWTRTWFRELQAFDFRAVSWAVVKVIRQPSEHPPSLGQFIEHVKVQERERGLRPPPPEEEDRHALWRELNPDAPEPEPMSREQALARIHEMGFRLPAAEGSG